ncbi:MAG: hypothetical protein ACREGF_01570 [Candidatus Saccharimonadales bacterium]
MSSPENQDTTLSPIEHLEQALENEPAGSSRIIALGDAAEYQSSE